MPFHGSLPTAQTAGRCYILRWSAPPWRHSSSDLVLKRSTTLIAVVALAGALGAAWWFQRPSAAPQAPPAPARAGGPGAPGGGAGAPVVESTLARLQPLSEQIEAVGSLRSRQGTMVRAEVGGRVTQINFRDGQRIRRG